MFEAARIELDEAERQAKRASRGELTWEPLACPKCKARPRIETWRAEGVAADVTTVYNLGVDHLGTPMRAWDDNAEFVRDADTNGMRQRRSHKTERGSAEHHPIARGFRHRRNRKDEAFGKAWEYLPESTSPPSIQVNLRFPGQYLDRETGLHYNAMRQRRSHKTLQGAAEHQPIARQCSAQCQWSGFGYGRRGRPTTLCPSPPQAVREGCPQRGHRKDNWHRYNVLRQRRSHENTTALPKRSAHHIARGGCDRSAVTGPRKDYDPNTGRYLTPDPVNFGSLAVAANEEAGRSPVQFINLMNQPRAGLPRVIYGTAEHLRFLVNPALNSPYAYVVSSPLMYVDPYGLICTEQMVCNFVWGMNCGIFAAATALGIAGGSAGVGTPVALGAGAAVNVGCRAVGAKWVCTEKNTCPDDKCPE